MVLKTFAYDAEQFGLKTAVSYQFDVPLPDFCSFDEVFGHFVCKTKLLEPFHKGARQALQTFIRNETQNHHDQIAEDAVLDLLNADDELDTTKIYSLLELNQPSASSINEFIEFNADFQYVMEHCTNDQLMRIVAIEQSMSREMKDLITARNYDLDRLRRACEDTVEKTSESTDKIEEHSYNLSILNEKLRQCNENYCNQRQAMIERHKNEFADIVRTLKKTGTIPNERFNKYKRFCKQTSLEQSGSRHSFQNIDAPRLEESFTIYIGAQMKSMHNARIFQFDRPIDVCHSSSGAGDFKDEQVYTSRRLNSLMSLYGRDLSASVLLVGRDPLYHLHSNTDFFRLCERSAELHFDNLTEQLKKIDSLVRSTNRGRKASSPCQQSFDHVGETEDESLLKPGDIYVTCHSNLSSAQVIFHLVSDKTLGAKHTLLQQFFAFFDLCWRIGSTNRMARALEVSDINSRHPCVNGLRNCVRLAARNAINTLTFPLFLVEEMKPNMTVQWCINRAELIFKCMKGFLMEVCSSGASSTANFPASFKPVHYNMNFVVPKLNRDVFESVAEMFTNIFHLVPTMVYLRADVIFNQAQYQPCQLNQIRFENMNRTKKSALMKETMELYRSRTLDELIRKAHIAANHMQEVGLVEQCVPFIEKCEKSKNGFNLRFVTKEPNALFLGAKMGVTTTGTADGSLTAAYKSAFGSAEVADISYSKAFNGGHNWNVNFIKPWLGWQSYRSSALNVRRSFENQLWNKTNLVENAVVLQHVNNYNVDYLSHVVRLNMIWRQFLATGKTAFQVREYAGHSTKFSVENVISYDRRDRHVLPETGYFAKYGVELAALMGDSSFVRNELFLQGAAKLPFDAFMNASFQTQFVQNIGNRSLHVLDRIYLGGHQNVRGFNLNSIGPRAEDCALGGAFSMAMAVHLFYPLYPKNIFFAHAFASAGSVVSVRSRDWLNTAWNTNRCSVGVGLVALIQQMLRLELSVVKPVASVPGDKCEAGVYFGAGAQFL